jgi:hypothetical protein
MRGADAEGPELVLRPAKVYGLAAKMRARRDGPPVLRQLNAAAVRGAMAETVSLQGPVENCHGERPVSFATNRIRH